LEEKERKRKKRTLQVRERNSKKGQGTRKRRNLRPSSILPLPAVYRDKRGGKESVRFKEKKGKGKKTTYSVTPFREEK